MIEVVNVKDYHGSLVEAAQYFSDVWGGSSNQRFYYDAMLHSYHGDDKGIPRFYLMLKNHRIIGCYALIINDFISRHDLTPWLAALYIDEAHRGQALGSRLLAHGLREARRSGYNTVYLTTDHDSYYEQYGWTRLQDGCEPSGAPTRIYMKRT